MKKRTIFGGILIIFISLILMGHKEALDIIAEDNNQMPEFTYKTLNGNEYTKEDLKENSRYMFVYFNPLCEVCQRETQELVTNMDFFKENDVQLILVSPNDKKQIEQFVAFYDLDSYDPVVILHDPEDLFFKEFGAIGYPNLFIYDEDKNLVQVFERMAEIEEIKQAFAPVMAQK